MIREKARIPAWTDRILRKGSNLRQLAYNLAPLRFSDHRPVYAIFECTVSIVNEKLRNKIGREIYERRKSEVGGDTANVGGDESEDEDLMGYDAIDPGLPPASSDRQKWWLENGKMARSTIIPPKPEGSAYQTILNPRRPANPYTPTDEPDWVNIPRSESRMSSFSSMSTSPYEHINHSMLLSSSAASSAPRRALPPPYDPAAFQAKVGRLQLNEDGKTPQADGPPPLPPPRRQTTMGAGSSASPATAVQQARKPLNRPASSLSASLASSVAQQAQQTQKPKAPPPVARKPAHLVAPVSPASSVSGSEATGKPEISFARLPELPRRSTGNVQSTLSNLSGGLSGLPPKNGIVKSDGNVAPQLPKRAASSANVVTASRIHPGGVGLVGLAGMERKSQLPERKPATTDSPAQKPAPPPPRRSPAVDLLADDGAKQVDGWEALKPTQ